MTKAETYMMVEELMHGEKEGEEKAKKNFLGEVRKKQISNQGQGRLFLSRSLLFCPESFTWL